MKIGNAIKRAPRWAWWTAGGLAAGGLALKLYRDRAAPEGEQEVAPAEEAGFQYAGPGGGSPPGVIVPPVIIPSGNGNEGGVGVLQQLYVDAVGGLISGWESVWGPVQTAQLELLTGNARALQDLALAGGPPQGGPTPVIVNVPQQQPAPAAIRPPAARPAPVKTPAPSNCPHTFPLRSARGCYRQEFDNRTRGTGKNRTCAKVSIHRYQNGLALVASEEKIKNGPC